MDLEHKVDLLAEAAKYDVCPSLDGDERLRGVDFTRFLAPGRTSGGGCGALLKVLQSNVCSRNCYYCAQRCGRDTRRTTLTPEELAGAFDQMYRRRLVRGLFLSSALDDDPHNSMDRMLATVEILRRRYEFDGYIHLKVLPGTSMAHVEHAVRLATRVSTNLEATSQGFLDALAPEKSFQELTERLRWARMLINGGGPGLVPAGITTQLVVGASGETDQDILRTSSGLYRDLDLRRVYYSAFTPVSGTPLEDHAPTPALRQRRLYQGDWLLRLYGFRFEELVFDGMGQLPLDADPKLAWADQHPDRFPIEVNRAAYEDLLRIPGVGPKAAAQIAQWRRSSRFHSLKDLTRTGAIADRAAPYVLLNGKRPPYQLRMWPP